jgi:diguanylate cyclase (GGDEF)-like protein
MGKTTRWWRHPLVVPALLVLTLVLATLFPTPLWIGLLLVAVIAAARQWPGWIAWGVAGLSVLLLGVLLWRLHSAAVNPELLYRVAFLWIAISLLTVAGTLGHATARNRSYARKNQELKEAQQRLDALYQITMAISTTLEPGGILAVVLERLAALGYDNAAILLTDEVTGELSLASVRGRTRLDPEKILRSAGLAGALQRVEPLVIQEPAFLCAFIPLSYEGKGLGLIYVERAADDGFTEADLTMLSTAAKGASARLVNARLYQQTRLLAITDPITELFNYRHYREQVAAHLRHSQLSGEPFALLMIDLDFFKHCNDTYGHVTGDAVLNQLGRILRDSCRDGDLCFRYGGEEFAVILPGVDREQARRVAERIRTRVREHRFLTSSGRPIDFPLSVSIGAVSYPDDGLTDIDLILAADRAMYRAKAGGRDRVVAGGDHLGLTSAS